jgi:GT2 family glycosyltransferase
LKLTVVIVNYNVEHFLEQCLHSVEKAAQHTSTEVWVVDNNSVDGSCAMVKSKFPWVKLVESKKNLGFSKGNNLAMKEAKGEYVLLLNPDTIVEEDTFVKIVNFMDEHDDAGGLGVHMVDGQGKFLPESKRGLPTPSVAFYKIFGLAHLFPKSKKFGKYHLGYLPKDKSHEVEILSGAFMLLRKSVLDKIGLLDETFFMYGEDIDLSYRIVKAGYKNYYFADTDIIHYKGESTKKSSVNYVFVFYRAMIIFAKKHFSHKNASLFSFLINIAIYARAAMAIFSRALIVILLPVFDAGVIYICLYYLMKYYETSIKQASNHFPQIFFHWEIPVFIMIWLLSVFYFKGFQKNPKPSNIAKGVLVGTFIILVLYSLLPVEYRFSRALILIGTIVSLSIIFVNRLILHYLEFKNFDIYFTKKKRIAIVGSSTEAKRVTRILALSYLKPISVKLIAPGNENEKDEDYIGNLAGLNKIVAKNKIDEVIFCAKNLSFKEIISYMANNPSDDVDFKIAPPNSMFIIGSHSLNEPGELYVIDHSNINKIENKKSKRVFDIITSLLLLVFFPILMFIVENPLGFVKNTVRVLFGKLTFVGYCLSNSFNNKELPQLKNGILNPTDTLKIKPSLESSIEKINLMYAKNYNIYEDLDILIKGLKKLGRVPVN